MTRAAIFAAVRAAKPEVFNEAPERIAILDGVLDDFGVAREVVAPKAHALTDPAIFFAKVREITGPLDQTQVDVIDRLLASAPHWPIGWLAYGLATAWHEARLKPIEEIGKGKGRPYGKPGKHGQSQHGRGLVQLTWDRNYEHADQKLGLGGKLVADFNLALDPYIASAILVRGMEEGWFTGKRLRDCIVESGTHDAFVKARRIINGTDRAQQIAGHAERFQDALAAGGWA